MDIKEYAELVEKTREAQNDYFRTRSSVALQVSKKREKELDEATETILAPFKIKNQQSLF